VKAISLYTLLMGLALMCAFPVLSDEVLVVGTWNIEDLPRSNHQERAKKIQAIAYLVAQYDIDILALQEVTHDEKNGFVPIQSELIPRLGGRDKFGYVVSSMGASDRLAYVYNKERVMVSCNWEGNACSTELQEIALPGQGSNRPALVLDVNKGDEETDFDFTILNIHAESGRTESATLKRAQQFRLLGEWILHELVENQDWRHAQDQDWDLLLVGDYNELIDSGEDEDEGRLDLLEMLLEFIPAGASTVVLSDDWAIDHIAVTKLPGGALEELESAPKAVILYEEPDFCSIFGTYTAAAFNEEISDHLPVIAVFRNQDHD